MFALLAVSFVAAITSLICFVIILIAAFEDEIWKGIVGFFFWPYLAYWAFVEYYDDGKWVKVGLWLGGAALAGVLRIGGSDVRIACALSVPGITRFLGRHPNWRGFASND